MSVYFEHILIWPELRHRNKVFNHGENKVSYYIKLRIHV